MSACSFSKPVIKTRIVEKQVPVYVRLDPELTKAASVPAVPAPECTDVKTGKPTICQEDEDDLVTQLFIVVHALNGQIQKIRNLQPVSEGER